jgi:hypothetical protein
VQAKLDKKQDPILKITREKEDEVVSQTAEFLPSKPKVLRLNPNTTKKFLINKRFE